MQSVEHISFQHCLPCVFTSAIAVMIQEENQIIHNPPVSSDDKLPLTHSVPHMPKERFYTLKKKLMKLINTITTAYDLYVISM